MLRIFLIRHGEVEGNSGQRPILAGWNDVPLTARGEAQTRAVARRLQSENLRAVHCSDLRRALHTAEPIAAPHGLKARAGAAWREVNYGAWTGLGLAEVVAGWPRQWQRRAADPENQSPPDGQSYAGESYADLWHRLAPAWESIVATHRLANHRSASRDHDSHGSVAVVAHNGPLRVLLCRLLGMPLANYRRIHLDNCGVSRVDIATSRGHDTAGHDAAAIVRFMNETSHLRDV